MATSPDRDELRSGLAALLAPGPDDEADMTAGVAPQHTRASEAPAPTGPATRAYGPTATSDRGGTGEGDSDLSSTGSYERTSLGYVRADGTELVRVSLMLTKDQRNRLRVEAASRGMKPTEYVLATLGW